jgi:hypothetical protein
MWELCCWTSHLVNSKYFMSEPSDWTHMANELHHDPIQTCDLDDKLVVSRWVGTIGGCDDGTPMRWWYPDVHFIFFITI